MSSNIYDQVQKLLEEKESRPSWADEILFELKEIKRELKLLNESSKSRKKDKAYFAFIKKLREELRADIINGIYPQIEYKGRELGINFKGYIYDKATGKDLSATEAFKVYRFLYYNKDSLDKYISK
jgi:hypothetical protein